MSLDAATWTNEPDLCLSQAEWAMLANIVAYYLRTTPPNVLPDQRALAECIRDACHE